MDKEKVKDIETTAAQPGVQQSAACEDGFEKTVQDNYEHEDEEAYQSSGMEADGENNKQQRSALEVGGPEFPPQTVRPMQTRRERACARSQVARMGASTTDYAVPQYPSSSKGGPWIGCLLRFLHQGDDELAILANSGSALAVCARQGMRNTKGGWAHAPGPAI